jgi:hypothetical protein
MSLPDKRQLPKAWAHVPGFPRNRCMIDTPYKLSILKMTAEFSPPPIGSHAPTEMWAAVRPECDGSTAGNVSFQMIEQRYLDPINCFDVHMQSEGGNRILSVRQKLFSRRCEQRPRSEWKTLSSG